jgi:uncharacterized protein (DUF2342 family)
MKNSVNTPATTVAASNTTKVKVQSMSVATVKAVFCVPHIIAQSTADLLNVTEAAIINKIDGTPVIESMMHRESYTREKMAKAVNYAIEQKAKLQAKLDSRKQQDINKLKTALDKLEGVEHITTTNAPKFNKETEKPVDTITIPAPFVPINKRKKEANPLPLMTPQAAFEPVV